VKNVYRVERSLSYKEDHELFEYLTELQIEASWVENSRGEEYDDVFWIECRDEDITCMKLKFKNTTFHKVWCVPVLEKSYQEDENIDGHL